MLALSACGSTSDATEGDAQAGESAGGLSAEATKDEFIAAFEDVDPVELTVQLATGPDNPYSVAAVAYTDAVTEWSGGKLTFDVLYSGSRAPMPEMNSALAEGLVDMGQHMPNIEADAFPVADYTSQLMFLQEGSPVTGGLQLLGAWTEFAVTHEALQNELRNQGIQPLLPMTSSGGTGLVCKGELSTLEDLKSAQVRTSSSSVASEVEALGAIPVSIPAVEQYEAMQRGAVDCIASSLGGAAAYGLHEVGDSWTLDQRSSFAASPVAWGMSAARWDSLPIVAQQLLWDRLDVFLDEFLTGNVFGASAAALADSEEAGLTVVPWGDDAAEALAQFHAEKLEELPGQAPQGVDGAATVETAVELHEKWLANAKELGYGEELPWGEFTAWYAAGDFDFGPFVDAVVEEVLVPNRPA
ncbi:hypothetical protein [Georgenia sp. AZ-5]|uniref:hypothetical protein n=1 Tax=Georgenia sp. AZ-5 TaxID=3367526 RepID=UPI0037550AED